MAATEPAVGLNRKSTKGRSGKKPSALAKAAPDTGLLQLLDEEGRLAKGAEVPFTDAQLLRAYRLMVELRILDTRALNLQRQGRIFFYAPCPGQEAATIGAALALEPEDWFFPTYRDVGACMARGMSWQVVMDQLFGNARDLVRGRQMPNHFADHALKIYSISSPIATQIPQAAGCGIEREE